MLPKIGVVVPCYNEEAILMDSSKKLFNKLSALIAAEKVAPDSFIAFVNDGSKDNTWPLIQQVVNEGAHFKGINLARNVGHQNAVYAGIATIYEMVDATISIDADLQDDIEVFDEMIAHFSAGIHMVYGVRKDRKSDTWFKRFTASQYYNVLSAMKVDIVKHHADFRLTSKSVNEALMQFPESQLFLRGIFPKIGYAHSFVYYDRLERLAGESKYPLKKMLALAWDGITSFSSFPLKLVFRAGVFMFFAGIMLSFYALYAYWSGNAIPGWASTVLPLYFLGAIQLLCVGILGEYIGKIYVEVKRRPRFFVQEILENQKP